jgi:hypothetical protein
MRNAMLPVVTVIGLEFAFLIGGLVVTEQVFNLNGIGRLFVQAVARSDYTMIQALVMLVAVCFILVNFIHRHALRRARPAHPVQLMATAPSLGPDVIHAAEAPQSGHAVHPVQPLGSAGWRSSSLMCLAAASSRPGWRRTIPSS